MVPSMGPTMRPTLCQTRVLVILPVLDGFGSEGIWVCGETAEVIILEILEVEEVLL
jgi:hypothetical protein